MRTLGVLVVVAGCSASTGEDLVGIYEVDSLTSNSAACAEGGSSILGDETFVLARTENFLGTQLLVLLSCASVDDCHVKADELDCEIGVLSEFSFTVEASGLTASGATSGFLADGVCTGGETTETVLVADGGAITVTQQITDAEDYPPEASGFCSTDDAEAAAVGKPCSRQQTLTAHFVESL